MSEDRWTELVETSVGGSVTVGTMFGCKGLRTGKKYFAIWWEGRLVLKLPAAQRSEVVGAGVGEVFEPMAGRPMNGWVIVDPSTDWPVLAADAQAYVESQQS